MGGPESRSGGMVGDYEVRRSWAQILTHEWVNAKRAECGESREGMEVKRTTRGKEGDLGRGETPGDSDGPHLPQGERKERAERMWAVTTDTRVRALRKGRCDGGVVRTQYTSGPECCFQRQREGGGQVNPLWGQRRPSRGLRNP